MGPAEVATPEPPARADGSSCTTGRTHARLAGSPPSARPGHAVLSERDRRALHDLEQHLRAEAPVLDLWLRTGACRGLPDRPRASYTVQAWPVVVLVAVGCALIAWGFQLPSVLPLVGGFSLVTFSFLGRWLPLRPSRVRRRPP